MKYLKLLGLAAVAATALIAFVGAGTASAVTLCTTDEPGTTTCTGSAWKVTHIEASQIGSGVLEDTSGNTLITCTTSSMTAGPMSTGGGAGTPSTGSVTALSFSNCNSTPVVLKKGTLSVNSSRQFISNGGEITASLFGVSCNYATSNTVLGTGVQGSDTLTINAVIKRSAGGFLCPETTKWTATFTITNHKAGIYVTTE